MNDAEMLAMVAKSEEFEQVKVSGISKLVSNFLHTFSNSCKLVSNLLHTVSILLVISQ